MKVLAMRTLAMKGLGLSVSCVCIVSLAACSLPAAAPAQTQHDLGGVFPQGNARSPVPLRIVQVSAQPLVASIAMQYREAAQPTRRGSYALNRWAASPATMVEAGLTRMLGLEGGAKCRVQFSLAEFIIDVDANGKSRALLAADAALFREQTQAVAQRSFDIAVPMKEAGPAAGALALREAVQKLAEESASWLGGNQARVCLP